MRRLPLRSSTTHSFDHVRTRAVRDLARAGVRNASFAAHRYALEVAPPRRALSLRYPRLAPLFLWTHIAVRTAQLWRIRLARSRSAESFPFVLARHSSLLFRRGTSGTHHLSEGKVRNLERAVAAIDGTLIRPGETFSFWDRVGRPTSRRGFAVGMLLSNGQQTEGYGGGLCQMSNMLYWLFLHSPLVITERFHHSRDVFPDDHRVLPFGSGATVMWNFIDLRAQNIGDTPILVRVWIERGQLRGELRTPESSPTKYHIREDSHHFLRYHGRYYRTNVLVRETLRDGRVVSSDIVAENFAPVLYDSHHIPTDALLEVSAEEEEG